MEQFIFPLSVLFAIIILAIIILITSGKKIITLSTTLISSFFKYKPFPIIVIICVFVMNITFIFYAYYIYNVMANEHLNIIDYVVFFTISIYASILLLEIGVFRKKNRIIRNVLKLFTIQAITIFNYIPPLISIVILTVFFICKMIIFFIKLTLHKQNNTTNFSEITESFRTIKNMIPARYSKFIYSSIYIFVFSNIIISGMIKESLLLLVLNIILLIEQHILIYFISIYSEYATNIQLITIFGYQIKKYDKLKILKLAFLGIEYDNDNPNEFINQL